MKVDLVGGAVRDSLLGLPFHEKDWVVVGATKEELLKKGINRLEKTSRYFFIQKLKKNML